MSRPALTAVVPAVAAVALLAVGCGCCDKYKHQVASLQQDLNLVRQGKQEVETSNKDLKARLAESQERQDELAIELEAKEDELATLKARLSQVGPGPARATTRPSRAPELAADDWQPTPGGAKITLASDVLFAPGKATLSKRGQAKMKRIAVNILSQRPRPLLRVYGYTDSDPIVRSARLWKDNLDLSANRAMAVTRELRKLGVPADRIETIGMGATNFVADNRTRAGKAKNRRVEIVVLRP